MQFSQDVLPQSPNGGGDRRGSARGHQLEKGGAKEERGALGHLARLVGVPPLEAPPLHERQQVALKDLGVHLLHVYYHK